MSGSHDKLPKLFWVQIILVVIVGTLYLVMPKADKTHGADAAEINPKVATVAKTLEPVGAVAVKTADTGGSSGTGQSAEEIYKGVCQTCHLAGIANAPKLDDKAAWEPRMALGLDSLVKTAITGKGAMPPKGGNMKLSDAEVKGTVIYMVQQAGFDVTDSSSDKTDKTDNAGETVQTAAPAATEPKVVDTTPAAPVVSVATGVATAPQAPAITSSPAAPVAPTPPADPMIKAAEPVAAKAATAPTVTEESPKAPEPAAVAQAPAPAFDLAKGEKIYKSACFACHESGVAGSPKLGDVAAWTARIAAGNDAMYNAAINGKGVMPPKGGNFSLSDEDVKAAVDYMVAKSK